MSAKVLLLKGRDIEHLVRKVGIGRCWCRLGGSYRDLVDSFMGPPFLDR